MQLLLPVACLCASIGLGVIGLFKRAIRGSTPLMVLNIVIAVVATANLLGRLAPDIDVKRFWGSWQFAVSAVGGILLMFAYTYQNPVKPMAKWLKVSLMVEPVITLLLALTDRWHPLMRQHIYLLGLGSPRYIAANYGLWFWGDIVYGSVLYLIAGSMLTQTLVRTPPVYRRKVALILLGLTVPLAGFILLLAGVIQIYQVEIYLAFLTVTSAFLAWGVYTRQFGSILPFARDTLFHDASQGILLADLKFHILDANPAALKLVGQELHSLAGKPIGDFLALDPAGLESGASQPEMNARTQKIQVNGRDLLVFFSPVKDQHTSLVGWLITLHDYTESRRLEQALAESELKYRNVADNADEGIVIIQDQVCRYVNTRLVGMGNFDRESVTGKPFTVFIAPQYREQLLKQYIMRIDEQDAPELYETVLLHSDGSEIEVEINANRIEYGGAPAVVAFVRDITLRKQTERELARVQARYRVFVEQSLDGFVLLDESGTILEWNRAMEDITLLCRQQVIGKAYTAVMAGLLSEEDRRSQLLHSGQEDAGVAAGLGVFSKALSETIICRPDGTRRITQQMVSPLQMESGSTLGISVRDLTGVKQVELQLVESEQRFRKMADAAPVMIWVSDHEGKIDYLNQAYRQFTGRPGDELLGFGWTGFVHPDDLLLVWEALKSARQEKRGFTLEYRMRRADGQYRWLLDSAVYQGSISGEQAGFSGSLVDISDHKERELELRSLNRAIEQSPVGVYIADLHGRVEYVNPRMCTLSGYPAVEILGKDMRFLISHETPANYYHDLWDQVSSGGEFHGEFCATRKNGEAYWVRVTVSGISDPAGQLSHYLAIEEDISAQRLAEEAMRQQTARMESIFNNPEIGIGLANAEGEYTFVNQHWADMLGYSQDEICHLTTTDITFPDDIQPTRELSRAMYSGQIDRFKIEKRYRRKDGSVFWGELVGLPIIEADSSIREGIGFITDISERRTIQEKLRESEALYRSIINASPDTIAITDLTGNIRYASPIALEMFGYQSAADLENRTLQEFLVPEDRERAIQNMRGLAQGEKVGVGEYRAIRKNGVVFYFEVNGEALRQQDGQPTGFVFVLRDVSVRKDMEAGRHQRMQELEALRETMTDISSELELSRVITAIVRRVVSLLGAGECEVGLVDPDSGKLVIVVSFNREKDYTGVQLDEGEGIMGRAVQTRRTVIIEDYATWEGRSAKFESIHRTVICVPLIYNQELLGAISVGANPDVKIFDLRDIRMIEMFSQQAAIAIHNARLFSEVQRLAVTDPLTDIFNRRAFFDRARQEYNRSIRYGHKASVIMLDVDHFKVINDRFGHAAGDEALRVIAKICVANTRDCDILGRYGGEEFVILVPETALNGSLATAQRLCDQIAAKSIEVERGVIRMTASIGVAELTSESMDLEALIDRADQALYRAKQSGRNRVAI